VTVLLLFLLFLVVVLVRFFARIVSEDVTIAIFILDGDFQCLALGGFALALTAPFVPGIKELVQPWQHLLDRRQLTRRAWLTARALRPGRSLRPRLPLRPGFALLALCAGLAWRSRFARCAGLAFRTGLAARTIRATLARMSLRSRPSGLALRPTRTQWSLPSLPALIVCHAAAPDREAR
jgi:hypothetical protein